MFLLFFKSLIKTFLHFSSECESNTNVEAIILTNEHTKIQVTIFTADAPTLTNLIELGCMGSMHSEFQRLSYLCKKNYMHVKPVRVFRVNRGQHLC